jgi:hypothetical protein
LDSTNATLKTLRFTGGRCRALWSLVMPALVLAGALPAAAAGPKFWDWPERLSFAEVVCSGAGLDTLGGLTAGPVVAVHAVSGPEVVWRVVADGRGGWYLGTGHAGEIHQVAADGTARLVARLESTEVFSLAVLPGGDLLAGGGPDGRLSRVTAAGEVTEAGRIDGSYIWALAVAEEAGVVWLATGAPAAVYRYQWRQNKLEKIASLPAQNAMDLALDRQGRLLVVTQGPGLVYRLATGGDATPRLLGEIAQDEARRLLRGPGGAFHVLGLASGADAMTSTPKGDGGSEATTAVMPTVESGSGSSPSAPAAALYRLRADDELERIWAGDRELMTAAWSARWGWLGAGALGAGPNGGAETGAGPTAGEDTRAVVQRLTGAWGTLPLASWPGGDVLDMVSTGLDGGFVLAQAHPAAVVVGAAGAERGEAVSPPLDGGLAVAWGRLRWEGVAGEGSPRWSVRGGRRALPDETWTEWSAAWTEADHALDLKDCRYLQWRVELPAPRADAPAWRVTGVSVSARQPNLPPVIEEFRWEQLRGVKLGGLLAGQSLVHEYRSGLRAEFTQQDPPEEGWTEMERSDPGRAVRVVTWRAVDPNGDRLEFRLEYRREGDPSWRPATAPGGMPEALTGTLGSWDTSALPDGRYALRLVASDQPDNPGATAAEAERTLGPVTVDNLPPQLAGVEAQAVAGGLTVRLRATDASGPLAGARLILPDGKAERLEPRDGICDSASESFEMVVPWPRAPRPEGARPWRLRVEVRDLAGNVAGAEVVGP